MNLLAQKAAVGALGEAGWVERGRAHNTRAKAALSEALRRAGIAVGESHCNFILADFGSVERADAALAALKARGVIVRPMGSYGLGQGIRITIGTDEECALVGDVLVAMAEPAHA